MSALARAPNPCILYCVVPPEIVLILLPEFARARARNFNRRAQPR